MLIAWMIFSTLFYSASLALWFIAFELSFNAIDAGFSISSMLLLTAIGLYSVVVALAIIYGWGAFRSEQKTRAGWIMLIPTGYATLIMLILDISARIMG